MHFLKNILLVILCCGTTNLFPVFYKGIVYKRYNNDLRDYQYVITLSDMHFMSKSLNLPQVNATTKLINNLEGNKNVLVIAEDMASYAGDNQFVKNLNDRRSVYRLADKQLDDTAGVNPLFSLVDFAQVRNLLSINVEYRFLRGMAIAGTVSCLVDKSHVKHDRILDRNGITAKALAKETLDAIQHIEQRLRNYKKELTTMPAKSTRACDMKVIEDYWKTFKDNYLNSVTTRAKSLLQFNGTLYQYIIKNIAAKNRSQFFGAFLTEDEDLLHIKTLDSLAHQGKDKKYIIIATGGVHNIMIQSYLTAMGFNQVLEEGIELITQKEAFVNKKKASVFGKVGKGGISEHALHTAKNEQDIASATGRKVALLKDTFFDKLIHVIKEKGNF